MKEEEVLNILMMESKHVEGIYLPFQERKRNELVQLGYWDDNTFRFTDKGNKKLIDFYEEHKHQVFEVLKKNQKEHLSYEELSILCGFSAESAFLEFMMKYLASKGLINIRIGTDWESKIKYSTTKEKIED